jgi:hypothetical protein
MQTADPRHAITPARQMAFSILLSGVTLVLCLLVAEAFLRLKNSTMTNYDIEMWRYANELKQKSDDPQIDFDHRHAQSALLQSTKIRLNSWGFADQRSCRRTMTSVVSFFSAAPSRSAGELKRKTRSRRASSEC